MPFTLDSVFPAAVAPFWISLFRAHAMWICPQCKESIEDQFDSCWKCASEVQRVAQPVRPTKPLVSFGFLMGLMIVVQLWVAASVFCDAPNPVRTSFRREQRRAALDTYSKDPSPENRAAWQKELGLARDHVSRRQFPKAGVLLALFAGADVIVILVRKQHHVRSTVPI